jgi:hypothetical protein
MFQGLSEFWDCLDAKAKKNLLRVGKVPLKRCDFRHDQKMQFDFMLLTTTDTCFSLGVDHRPGPMLVLPSPVD